MTKTEKMSGQCVGYEKPLRGKEMRMKRDQKGFTIVELLIAVAILSIVILTVCGFILVGSRSYAAGNSDISVQQEAQLALNQMSDLLIDTTRSVTYTGFDAAGTTSEVALKDADFTFTPENKSLVMLNGTAVANPSGGPDIIEEGNGNKNYHFYWDKSEETLFYAEADAADPVPDYGDPAAEWVVLASHVTDFSVDLTQLEEKRVVQLALSFMDGTKEYVTSNNVTIRNKVGVNDAKLDPVNKKKTLSITPRDNAIIEPGETYHFSTPKVTGENVTDRSVTWSLAPSPDVSSGTYFTDDQNGILKVAEDQKAGPIDVVITTNAVDSDGNPASCTMAAHIKRVYPEGTGVVLAKTADTEAENGPNEISPGCTFTITATVSGYKLGDVCSVCGDDVTMDKQVSYVGNPYGNPYPWRIYDPSSVTGSTTHWNPNEYIDILDSGPNHATFYMHDDAPTSNDGVTYGVVIQAMSLLSTQPNPASGRNYDQWVPGAISFNMVKRDDDAEPYGGKLKYGEQTLDKSVTKDLPTDFNKYVTAIRVVDNAKKQPDRILLHYTIGGGADYRICPDLFDLDLNGSYTFYIQALFPIAEDRYEEGKGGYADDNETIRTEYFNNIKNNKASQGYNGTKYRHSKVFSAKLDRPKITFNYQGVEYRGRNITYDPVNVYTTNRLIEEIKPIRYENIEGNQGMNGMVYSLYEGEGSVQSQWNKLYYYDEQTMSYQGSNTIGDGAGSVNPGGNPFMQLNDFNKREKVCGNYHIVPGMLYQNKEYGNNYEIIGYQGFDYPNLPRDVRYYEFDESTIHAKVSGDFTMEINHDRFRGKVMFPLPEDMQANPLFPNMNSLDWQTSSGSLTVPALRDGQYNGENRTFSYINYRYIKADKAWEVELFEEEILAQERKIRTYSYGVYKCKENEKKWTFVKSGATTDRELKINLEGLTIKTETRSMYFPLPSEVSFPFKSGTTKIDCNSSHVVFDDEGKADQWWLQNKNVRIKYEYVGNVHRIIFVNKYYEPEEFGAFECTAGGTKWTKVR